MKVLLIYSIRIYSPKKLDSSTNKREWDTILAGMENNIKLNSKWLRSWRLYVVYILIGLFILALHSQYARLPPLSLTLFCHPLCQRGPSWVPSCSCNPVWVRSSPFCSLAVTFYLPFNSNASVCCRCQATPYDTIQYDTIRYNTTRRFRFRFPVKFDMNI